MISVLIPARAGSKGLKLKNIKNIGSYNLIEIAILQARKIFGNVNIFVSTESEKIIENIHLDCNNIKRPAHLAEDNTSTIAVIKHALKCIDTEWICLMQPTNPFRDYKKLKDQLKMFFSSGSESSMSGNYSDYFRWKDGHRTDCRERLRRQDRDILWQEDGCFYIFNRNVIHEDDWIFEGVFHFENTPCQIDIHSQEDLDYARKLWNKDIFL